MGRSNGRLGSGWLSVVGPRRQGFLNLGSSSLPSPTSSRRSFFFCLGNTDRPRPHNVRDTCVRPEAACAETSPLFCSFRCITCVYARTASLVLVSSFKENKASLTIHLRWCALALPVFGCSCRDAQNLCVVSTVSLVSTVVTLSSLRLFRTVQECADCDRTLLPTGAKTKGQRGGIVRLRLPPVVSSASLF